MPTRIVLDTNPVPSQLTPHRQNPVPHIPIRRIRQSREGTPWSFDDGSNYATRRRDLQDPASDRDINTTTPQAGATGGGSNLRNRYPLPDAVTTTPPNKRAPDIAPATLITSSRRTSGFRSSVLRELSLRQDSTPQGSAISVATEEQHHIRVSGEDIRASPRFLGYLFSAIAGSVLLVSVVQ